MPKKRVIPFAPRKKGRPRGRPFLKGQPRHPEAGRRKGTPNKLTVAVKEFMKALIDDPEVQVAMKQKVLEGDGMLFIKMVEQVEGRATEKVEVTSPGLARLLTLAFERERELGPRR